MGLAQRVLPSQSRQWMRRTYNALRFNRAVRRFAADPTVALSPDSDLLPELIAGWGNAGWSAREEYLRACIAHALATRGPTLECGSGLSTLLLGVVALRCGYRHWALEHLPDWIERVAASAEHHGIEGVRLCLSPLRSYNGFSWYAPPLEQLPRDFALVLCDGPPADTGGGRYGLLPVMRSRLAPGCVILLDDAERAHERAIAKRWQLEAGAQHEFVAGARPYIRLVLPGRH